MKIVFLLTGKTQETYIKEGILIYEKRLNRYISFETIIISKQFASYISPKLQLLKNEDDLKQDSWGSPSPEASFSDIIQKNLNGNGNDGFSFLTYDLEKNNFGENCLGYFHIEGNRGWH